MNAIRPKLESLKIYASQLAQPTADSDKIKTEALKTLTELETFLKDKTLDNRSWNEIYETIRPFNKLDLSVKAGIIGTITSIFTKTVPPKEQVDKLIAFVDEKRIAAQINQEKAEAKGELATYLEEKKPASVSDVLKFIQDSRMKNPRYSLSIKDEFELWKELLREKIQKLGSSSSSSAATELIFFEKHLKACVEETFAFSSLIQKCQTKQGPSGVTVLQPKFKDIDDASIRLQRLFRLHNLQQEYQKSIADPNCQVTGKYFPPVCAWCVGSTAAEKGYLEIEMQAIGNQYGILTIADWRLDEDSNPLQINEGYKTDFMLDPKSFTEYFGPSGITHLYEFNQDFVDFSKNGQARFPRMKTPNTQEDKNFYENIAAFRSDRSKIWKQVIEDASDTPLLFLGPSFVNDYAFKAVGLASTLGAVPVMNLTYNEGGNTLIGQRASGPYVIIGKDSYDVSKKFMEKDLGRQMSDEEVRMAFAVDYGVSKESVYFVEQPGDFHLDMSMAIVGENTILLNDAVEAQNLFAKNQDEWLQELAKDVREEAEKNPVYAGNRQMIEQGIAYTMSNFEQYQNEEIRQAKTRKQLEDIAEQDLIKQGFKVVRVPGRFHYNARQPAMNLFNFVGVKTPNGKNIVVSLGCINKEFEKHFEQALTANSNQKIDAFHYLSLVPSQDCLLRGGGISCRTKLIPQ
jgi:hypothetical protein